WMVFDKNNNILEADDGGIYRLNSPNDAARNWTSVIGNLAVAEFYSGAYDAATKRFFGGLQDEGVVTQSFVGSLRWDGLDPSADGAIVQVDNTSLADKSIHYTTSNEFKFFRKVTYNKDGTIQTDVNPAATVVGAIPKQSSRDFDP